MTTGSWDGGILGLWSAGWIGGTEEPAVIIVRRRVLAGFRPYRLQQDAKVTPTGVLAFAMVGRPETDQQSEEAPAYILGRALVGVPLASTTTVGMPPGVLAISAIGYPQTLGVARTDVVALAASITADPVEVRALAEIVPNTVGCELRYGKVNAVGSSNPTDEELLLILSTLVRRAS